MEFKAEHNLDRAGTSGTREQESSHKKREVRAKLMRPHRKRAESASSSPSRQKVREAKEELVSI